ncbi:MAG TPA: formate dehydrogenase accessory sulfurtransferase FdhD, partial [Pseudomonadota bacterium]|nr:formate dehydrogenase accessory sulfurtransferase FdhD [Pseudomonadota bacterium]
MSDQPSHAQEEGSEALQSSQRRAVYAVEGASGETRARFDELAAEEPLEIRVLADWVEDDASLESALVCRQERTISLTLRTPGLEVEGTLSRDCELALGYLFSEGLLSQRDEIESLRATDAHRVIVQFRPGLRVPWRSFERQGFTHSACGLCGRRSLDALLALTASPAGAHAPPTALPPLPADRIAALPAALREAQAVFARTGGLHAAALFDWTGGLRLVREDIGRHNAVDKLIGAALWAAGSTGSAGSGAPAWSEQILVVSGRAGFELLQKAYRAGFPVFVAVGAPSSLAVRLAQQANITLVGFCRDGRFNVYSGPERIAL